MAHNACRDFFDELPNDYGKRKKEVKKDYNYVYDYDPEWEEKNIKSIKNNKAVMNNTNDSQISTEGCQIKNEKRDKIDSQIANDRKEEIDNQIKNDEKVKNDGQEDGKNEKTTLKRKKYICSTDLLDNLVELKPNSVKKILTGIKGFDDVTGGISPGLYTIGGNSSTGKTAFCMQLADTFAKQDKTVLFFNLEMYNTDLLARSVSRYMYIENGLKTTKTNSGERLIAKESRELTDYNVRQTFNDEEKNAFDKAVNSYEKDCKNKIIFFDRNYKYIGNQVRVEEIRQIAEDVANEMTKDFVVIVDFLQVLADRYYPADERKTIDRIVSVLKDVSVKHRVPVLLISAVSRTGYKEQFEMNSFKSSGMIEYASDGLFGLQLSGLDFDGKNDKDESERKARIYEVNKIADKAKGNPEQDLELQLKVLKMRNIPPFTVDLRAKLGFCYFESGEKEEPIKQTKGTTTRTVKAAPKTEKRTVQARTKKNTKQIEIIEQNEKSPFAF